MQTIGERLEEARKRKGVSIREAAEATKIRSDYLHKFESNAYDLNLPEIYISGFLRSYATYLKLPADKIVAEYKAAGGSERKSSRRERDTREIYGRMELGGADLPKETKAGATETEAADDTPAPARSGSRQTYSSAPAQGIDQALLIKGGVIVVGTLVAILLVVLIAKALFSHSSPTSSAATLPPAAVQAEAAQTLNLTGLDTTRVKVVQELDNAVLFNGTLTRGETRSLQKKGKLLITVEIGRNLRLDVNGRNYPVPIDGYGRFGLD